jgi:hypothetical protein
MKYFDIEVQAHEDRLWRLNRLCGMIGYIDAVIYDYVSSAKDIDYHIEALYDHKGCLEILWKNYDPRVALVISDAWHDHGNESHEAVKHYYNKEDMELRPESFKPQIEA